MDPRFDHEYSGYRGDCTPEHRYTTSKGCKGYFCTLHQHWLYESPTKTVYHYCDETTHEVGR